jgi:hypothetical protein
MAGTEDDAGEDRPQRGARNRAPDGAGLVLPGALQVDRRTGDARATHRAVKLHDTEMSLQGFCVASASRSGQPHQRASYCQHALRDRFKARMLGNEFTNRPLVSRCGASQSNCVGLELSLAIRVAFRRLGLGFRCG